MQLITQPAPLGQMLNHRLLMRRQSGARRRTARAGLQAGPRTLCAADACMHVNERCIYKHMKVSAAPLQPRSGAPTPSPAPCMPPQPSSS